MPTITRNQNRRALLAPTSLPVNTAKTVSALTRSGTTATATATSHGFSVGDWVLIQGSNLPNYNGPFQVVTTADANTFTYTMEADPGASSAGSITAIKGVGSSIWGDGSGGTVGALPTAFGGVLVARMATTTAPTTAPRLTVFSSPSGAAGTWRERISVDGTVVANDQSTHFVAVDHGSFVLAFFWRVAGTAVVVDAVGQENTSYSSA
jgi:hypothetical protein